MRTLRLSIEMKGILLDQDYSPTISGRTLAIGETTRQNQALILLLHKGELKENPAVGVGISDMLLDHDPLHWRQAIREQLEMDGQVVSSIRITNHGITIDAEYI